MLQPGPGAAKYINKQVNIFKKREKEKKGNKGLVTHPRSQCREVTISHLNPDLIPRPKPFPTTLVHLPWSVMRFPGLEQSN